MLSLLVFAVTGTVWLKYRELANGLGTSNAIGNGPKSADGGTNILLIGLDSRKDQDGQQLPQDILDKLHAGDGEEGGYNTNTLILLHLPPDGRKATAFSIPRDDAVDIPGEHQDKIKKAYGYAKAKAETQLRGQGITDLHTVETQSREAGRRATLMVVRELTGVPIDHFAEANLAGFYDVATALGGVEVCLIHPAQDDYSGADFPPGRQTLDGAQALAFVRQRHNLPNGDLDRTHRQQAFLASVASKLRDAGTFTDTGRLQRLIDVAKNDVVIDTGWDVLTFAEQAQNLAGGNLEFRTLPITGFGRIDGQAVNLIDPGQIRDIVQVAFGDKPPPAAPDNGGQSPSPGPPPPPPSSTVDVLNASGVSGLAGEVSDRLAQQGYGKGQVSNATDRNGSSVRYASGAKTDADRVGQQLGGLQVAADDVLPKGHIQVVLGGTFALPAGHAAAAEQSSGGAPGGSGSDQAPGPEGASVGGAIPCVN